MGRLRIGELLLEAKVISREQLDAALEAKKTKDGRKLGQILIEMGALNETQLTQTLSQQLSVPWVSLHHVDFSRQLLNRISREIAERYCLVPIYVRHVRKLGDTLYVAMDDPTNEAALAEVEKAVLLPVKPMIACASDIRSAIRVYYAPDEEDGPPTVTDRSGMPGTTREPSRPPPPPIPVKTKPSRPPPASVRPRAVATAEPAAPPPPPAPPPPIAPRAPERKKRPGKEAKAPKAEPSTGPAPRMISMTLLDGTTIQLPARKAGRSDDEPLGMQGDLTARDFVTALRAVAHGQDATEVLGEKVPLEAMCAALLSILLKKGLVADWEFVEELRKM